jgi:hypothetical protein
MEAKTLHACWLLQIVCQKLSTHIKKTFNMTAVHSYRFKIALSSRLGGKTLVLYGFGKLLPSRFINLTCVCLSWSVVYIKWECQQAKKKSYWHSANGHAVLEIPLHEPEFELGVQWVHSYVFLKKHRVSIWLILTPVFGSLTEENVVYRFETMQLLFMGDAWSWRLNQIDRILVERRWHSSVLDVPSFREADCDAYNCLVAAEVRERLSVSKRET